MKYFTLYFINQGGDSMKNETKENKRKRKNKKILILVIFLLGVFLIFSTYAWFSTNLNVKINMFKVHVDRNSGLSISFDGINFDSSLEISAETLVDNLKETYPNNLSHWASNGLVPVSSNGNSDANSYFFDVFYSTGGVMYAISDKDRGFIRTAKANEDGIKSFSRFIAFDLFFRNETGSPLPDNLYFDPESYFTIPDDADGEMFGLLNSLRIGIIKVGSLPLDANPRDIQNIQCNNNCSSIIYEPHSKEHSGVSIERANKYGINLRNGEKFPTYGNIQSGRKIYVENTVSGSPNIDHNYFELQSTMTDDDLSSPLFEIPDGITKTRVYVWIEGQDIDSLETDSVGTDLSLFLSFVKDTAGYNDYEN